MRTLSGAVAIAVLLLSGCVRSSVEQITSDTAMISARGTAFDDMGGVEKKMLLDAAELTVKNGYDWFAVTSAEGGYRTSYIAIPGQTQSSTNFNAYGAGNSIFGNSTTSTYTTPATISPVEKPRGSISIKMGHDPKPAGDNIYDAREVIQFQSQ